MENSKPLRSLIIMRNIKAQNKILRSLLFKLVKTIIIYRAKVDDRNESAGNYSQLGFMVNNAQAILNMEESCFDNLAIVEELSLSVGLKV